MNTYLSQSSPESYARHLDHFIRQMPGFVAWKTPDSVYASTNLLCAQLAGYKNIDSYIGTTDYEWKCDAVEFAEDIRKQDQLVLSSNTAWNSFNIMKFNKRLTYYFSHKSVIVDPTNKKLGILFVGTILTDDAIIKALTSLANSDPQKSEKKIQTNIYSIAKEYECPYQLSQRQQECLFYLLKGNSAKQIGKLLNISNRTVEGYIDHLKVKFGCLTRQQLFEKAIAQGYYYKIPESLLQQNGLIFLSSSCDA